MSDADVLFEKKGAIGLITLNRPKALNALTHGMCLVMDAQLKEWEGDDDVAAVVIRGAGDKAFCAGGDIRALYDSGRAQDGANFLFYRDEYRLNRRIKHYPKPYIALIDGIVMGGGVGVSVHGSHRVASEKILFAMPETGIGLFPDVGGTYFLPRCPGEIGLWLGLTGARLKAADCLAAGIATAYVPSADLDALVERLAAGEAPDAAIAALSADPGPAPLAADRAAIDRLFAGDTVEGILAALEADGSDFAARQAKVIGTKSPGSLKLTLRQLRTGATLDFDACMRLEYRLALRACISADFLEGVRAVIIDKDQAPRWQAASLDAVDEAAIDAYFAPLPDGDLVFA